jgi:hypothetical protein
MGRALRACARTKEGRLRGEAAYADKGTRIPFSGTGPQFPSEARKPQQARDEQASRQARICARAQWCWPGTHRSRPCAVRPCRGGSPRWHACPGCLSGEMARAADHQEDGRSCSDQLLCKGESCVAIAHQRLLRLRSSEPTRKDEGIAKLACNIHFPIGEKWYSRHFHWLFDSSPLWNGCVSRSEKQARCSSNGAAQSTDVMMPGAEFQL